MSDDNIIRTVVFGFVALIFVLICTATLQFRAEAKCAQLGYPNSKLVWYGKAYCIKRINQTDTIIPLP